MFTNVTFGRKASWVCFLLAAIVLSLAVLLLILGLLGPATVTLVNGTLMVLAGCGFRIYDAEFRAEQGQAALKEAHQRLELYQRITR